MAEFPHQSIADNIARHSPAVDQLLPEASLAADRVLGDINAKYEIDSKTGLLNEQPWRNRVSDQIASLEEGDRLTVTVADADGFKKVNDDLGHVAGDELLGIIGEAFGITYRRDTDLVARGSRDSTIEAAARLGGDEFAASVVTRTDSNSQRHTSPLESTLIQNGRVNEEIAERTKGTKFEKYGITITTGSSGYQPGDTTETIFARADAEMFTKKYQNKRDQITPEDAYKLRELIPYLDKVGHRVDTWLREAVLEFSEPEDK